MIIHTHRPAEINARIIYYNILHFQFHYHNITHKYLGLYKCKHTKWGMLIYIERKKVWKKIILYDFSWNKIIRHIHNRIFKNQYIIPPKVSSSVNFMVKIVFLLTVDVVIAYDNAFISLIQAELRDRSYFSFH